MYKVSVFPMKIPTDEIRAASTNRENATSYIIVYLCVLGS